MKRYPEYKKSDAVFIGEIPKDWDTMRCTHLFEVKQIKKTSGEINLSVYRDYGVIKRDSRDDNYNRIPEDTSNYKLVESGDFVFNKMKCWQGSLGVSEYRGIVSPAYTVCKPKRHFHGKYFHYLLRSQAYIQEFNRLSYGVRIGQWELRFEDFKDIVVPYPSLSEQTQIANFLDRKTEQIDELIRIKERRIELLQAQRTALINQAVTKGLDPNVEMKPSGVEGIGEIPAHWEVIPIKHTLQIAKDSIRTGPFGSSLKSHEFQDKGIRVYNQQSVYNEDFSKSDVFISEEKFNELRSFIVQPKDVLITSRGTIGKMTIVPKNGEIGVLHPCLIRLRLNENKLIPKYLWWYVNHSSFFIESVKIASNSTTIDVIYSETLSSVKIPIPTVKEQLEILEFLNVKIPIIDTIISNERKRIELLKEYRQSLISEVVTGKIDVRNEV